MSSTDLVVVLPGILGSTLRRRNSLVWAPSAGSVLRAVSTFGASLTDLRLPDGIGDGHPDDDVEAVTVMPDLHAIPGLWTPIKGYDPLLNRLRSTGYRDVSDDSQAPPGNLLPIAYDWRLSNRYNGQRLAGIVEPALGRWRAQGGQYTTAQVVFVCHSMGGLAARWYIQQCGGADITRKLILLGTPYRGAVKALVQLANGVDPRLGSLAERLNGFAGSLPSLHQLLPAYACLDRAANLTTLTETPVAGLDTAMVGDAMRFHRQLDEAEAGRDFLDATHLILGVNQSTATTARVTDGRVVAIDTYLGDDLTGDATVPVTGATPPGLPLDSNRLRRIADKHGNLQRNNAALDEIESILTSRPIIIRAETTINPRVTVPELVLADEPIVVDVTMPDRVAVLISLIDEAGSTIDARTPRLSQGHAVTTFTDLQPGAYTVDVTGITPASPVAPVSSDLLVWPA